MASITQTNVSNGERLQWTSYEVPIGVQKIASAPHLMLHHPGWAGVQDPP